MNAKKPHTVYINSRLTKKKESSGTSTAQNSKIEQNKNKWPTRCWLVGWHIFAAASAAGN